MSRRRAYAPFQKDDLTFWATPSVAVTRQRRARPISARARQRRPSGTSAGPSARPQRDGGLLKELQERIAHLNRKLVGWGNYFCLGPVSKAYRSVDSHTRQRLRWWLCNKHKIPGMGTARFPDEVLYGTSGPDPAGSADAQLSVGERMTPCPRAGCGKSARPVR